eukprot:GILK01009678.1.p1 GENE.GILK01009678.1~~GILK01009678.1.p1  ORF type:complete len:1439 (-),score=332.19 GILK01009678.1:518-4336(-)
MALKPMSTYPVNAGRCPANTRFDLPEISKKSYSSPPPASSAQKYRTRLVPAVQGKVASQQVIDSMDFTIEKGSKPELIASVSSDFATADMHLYLKHIESGKTVISKARKNHHVLVTTPLPPGRYKLSLSYYKRVRFGEADSSVDNLIGPKCIDYTFMALFVEADRAVSATDKVGGRSSTRGSNPVSAEWLCRNTKSGGEPVPNSLNHPRYLGSDGMMHDQGVYLIPPLETAEESIRVSVETVSYLRVYIEPHHININVELVQIFESGSESSLVKREGYLVEETLLYQLMPDTKYRIILTYKGWHSKLPLCLTYRMELSIRPVSLLRPLFNPETSRCAVAAVGRPELWPPSIPSVVPTQPPVFSYDSVLNGEVLYFKQSSKDRRNAFSSFNVTETVSLRLELGFDFLTSAMASELSRGSSSTQLEPLVTGNSFENRHVLMIESLPPGQYTLSLYEPFSPPVPGGKTGCSEFTAQLEVAPSKLHQDVRGRLALSNAIAVPETLPVTLNTVGYLSPTAATNKDKQGVGLLLTGPYVLFFAHESIQFTVKVTSMMRVLVDSANPHSSVQLTVFKADTTADPVLPKSSSFISGVLDPGSYDLKITYKGEGKRFVTASIGIAPLANLARDLLYHSTSDSCQDSTLPGIDVSSRYKLDKEKLFISESTMSSNRILYRKAVTLRSSGKIQAEVGSNFVFNPLRVSVQIPGGDWVGVQTGHSSVLDVTVPAGQYNVTISQLTPLPADYTHCTAFSLSLAAYHLNDAKPTASRCAKQSALPFELNAEAKALKDGSLSLRGNGYMIPKSSDVVDRVMVEVSDGHVIRTFVRVESSSVSVATQLMTHTDEGSISPVQTLVTPLLRETSNLWKVDSSLKRNEADPLYLVFHYPKTDPTIECPSFDLNILVRPLQVVTDLIGCPVGPNPSQSNRGFALPNPRLELADNGVVTERIRSSYITSQFAAKHHRDEDQFKGFVYSIEFTLTQQSQIKAEFAFSSLVNLFEVELHKKMADEGSNTRLVFSADAESVSVSTDSMFDMQRVLYGQLSPGSYSILIIEMGWDLIFKEFAPDSDTICFPFAWTVAIEPSAKHGRPAQPSVQPASGESAGSGELNRHPTHPNTPGAAAEEEEEEQEKSVSEEPGCGHGHWSGTACVCDDGYEGRYCDQCADGFYFNGHHECVADESVVEEPVKDRSKKPKRSIPGKTFDMDQQDESEDESKEHEKPVQDVTKKPRRPIPGRSAETAEAEEGEGKEKVKHKTKQEEEAEEEVVSARRLLIRQHTMAE